MTEGFEAVRIKIQVLKKLNRFSVLKAGSAGCMGQVLPRPRFCRTNFFSQRFSRKLYHLWVLSWLVSLDTDYMGRFQEKYSGGFFSVRRENGNYSLVFHDYFFQISFFAHTFHSKKRRFEKGTFCVCVCTRYFIRYNIVYQIFLSLEPSNPQRRLSVHPFYPNKFPNLRHDLKQQGHKQEKSDI